MKLLDDLDSYLVNDRIPPKIPYTFNYQLLGSGFLRYSRWEQERQWEKKRNEFRDGLRPSPKAMIQGKELMLRHYLEGRYANGVKKVAWITSGAPIEILKALDFFTIYPENHAALCGVRKQVVEIATPAEEAGYSRDLCSYARTDIGSMLSGKTPAGRLPKPDLLVVCNNICQTVLFWYKVLAAHFKVPLFVLDTPFLYHEVQPHQLDYVKKQFEELITVAERVAGKTFPYQKFEKVLLKAKEASDLWLAILDMSQHKPAPMTAFDGYILMGPIVDLRGEDATIRYYNNLLAELKQRVARGEGAIEHERKRVLWDNLPIWFKIRDMSTLLAQRGVNVVASTYTYAWGELAPMMDEKRPIESMANVYLHPILNRSTGDKLKSMERMVKDFACDGVILHSDRSCKPYSVGQQDQRERLASSGVAALLLEADHNDPRSYSEEQAQTRIDAFIEMMEN